jgi:hypothetical protein
VPVVDVTFDDQHKTFLQQSATALQLCPWWHTLLFMLCGAAAQVYMFVNQRPATVCKTTIDLLASQSTSGSQCTSFQHNH